MAADRARAVAVVRQAPPTANDAPPEAPQERTMLAIAREFGFKGPRSVRDWCKRRGISYRRDGKINWVDRQAVLRFIQGDCRVVAAPPPPPGVNDWVTALTGPTKKVSHG